MKRVRKESPSISTIALAVALAVTASVALAQGKKPPGGEETSANNLSYPAVEINNAGPTVATFYWSPAASPVLGKDFSWGCPVPVDRFPNTSCVNSTGTLYYTPAVCIEPGMPCAGQPLTAIDPIFWQKTTTNEWSAVTSTWTTSSSGPMTATHVDWADNLETQTWWDTASIRVETTPFGTTTAQTGVEMWHVYGQGQTELWGAHAAVPSAAYTYESVYPILHTLDARLNIAKISGPVTDCANSQPTGAGAWVFDDIDKRYEWNASQLTLYDVPYTAELNIGGKYVYGFNWQLRRDSVPASISKTGWWRLTFYTKKTPIDDVIVSFPSGAATFIDPPNGTPPADAKYRPVVSQADALSYIDICVSSSKGGGGKKGPK